MKARVCFIGLALVAASWLVAGCNMVDKKKYDEADARAVQATTRLNDTQAALDKAKADCAKLESSVKQKDIQLTALKAENKQAADSARAETKRLSDELKAARDKADSLSGQLEQANAKARDVDRLNATVQKLDQENKRLQAALAERMKAQATREPNAPGTGMTPR